MLFNRHSELVGRHAFLSASQYSWINYEEEKLAARFRTAMAAAKGTEQHDFAAYCIRMGEKLAKSNKTLNRYVNDCIGFGMIPEQPLYASDNAFGTADAIKFQQGTRTKPPLLRIFDLKTGVTPASFKQLMVYAAFFCIEYNFKPTELDFELRIYQNDAVEILEPEVHDIAFIIDRFRIFDPIINELKEEV